MHWFCLCTSGYDYAFKYSDSSFETFRQSSLHFFRAIRSRWRGGNLAKLPQNSAVQSSQLRAKHHSSTQETYIGTIAFAARVSPQGAG